MENLLKEMSAGVIYITFVSFEMPFLKVSLLLKIMLGKFWPNCYNYVWF